MSKKDFYDKLKIVTDAIKNISDAIKKHWKAILWVIAGLGGLSGIAYNMGQPAEVKSAKPVCKHSFPQVKTKTVIINRPCKCDLKKHVKKYHK